MVSAAQFDLARMQRIQLGNVPGLFGLGRPNHLIHGLDRVDVLGAHLIVMVVENMRAHGLKQVLGGHIGRDSRPPNAHSWPCPLLIT